jgi:SAM-dependent methyltransferase
MKEKKTSQLYDMQRSREFYEERYGHGYMDEWSLEKKQRIFEVIRSLDLPERGDALDFGCGNGVLTEVVRQALPTAWKIYGTDLSSTAVENARVRYPACVFFSSDSRDAAPAQYDFLFTHHVLEHVYDLEAIIDAMEGLQKDQAAMLHILPCGNEGSFEHGICRLRSDGINAELQNRYFYEDEGHVRRLTGGQLDLYFIPRGYELAVAYYSHQYFGALDWISQSDKGFIRMFADPSKGRDPDAARALAKLRRRLLWMHYLRYPALLADRKFRKSDKTLFDLALLICAGLLYPFAKPADHYIKWCADREWRDNKSQHKGSEMYHFYKRTGHL